LALVEAIDKKVIVKINDVGPLKPGRVIDLNEQTMRYFDPTLQLGLIHNIKVTPLSGDDWSPGPIAER
jgi:rare lipoprotein A